MAAHSQEHLENKSKSRRYGWLSGTSVFFVLALGIAWKVLLLALDLFPFNADEAIVGLMAKHILEGKVPTFFYGQAYMGSLDAILVAPFMALFGEQVWVIRMVQILLFAALLYLVFRLAHDLFHSTEAALAATVLLAVPSVNVTLYTTVSLGGYNEALLIGALFLLQLRRAKERGLSPARVFFLALMAGFGLWVFGLSLVFTLPGMVVLIRWITKERESQTQLVAITLAGLLIGASPWIVGAVQLGPQALLAELFGSAIAGTGGGGLAASWLSHVRNFLLFGPTVILGLRPPWSAQALLPVLAPIPLVFWICVVIITYQRIIQQNLTDIEEILLGAAGLLGFAFIITPFGGDPSGRYFLPLSLVLSLLAGGALVWLRTRGKAAWGRILVAGLLLFHIGSTLQAAYRDSEGLTTQFDPVARLDFANLPALVNLLEAREIHYGYTNYWVAYPLAFKTDEEFIFVPSLPYHQDFRFSQRDNRYPPYSDKVEAAERIAYITSNHPDLDEAIMSSFETLGVHYQWTYIEPFMVFHDLSMPVRPDQLDLPNGSGTAP